HACAHRTGTETEERYRCPTISTRRVNGCGAFAAAGTFLRSDTGRGLITLPPHNFHSIVQSRRQVWAYGCRGRGSMGMFLWTMFQKLVCVLTERRYRPELHYMRGPGPKWLERHGRS